MPRKPPRSTFRRLLQFVAAHRVALAASILLALGSQAFALAVPNLTGHAIDAIRAHHHARLRSSIELIVGAGILSAILMAFRRQVAGKLSLDVEYDLRETVYLQLQRLSYGFYDHHQTGQLLSRATSDVSAVRVFLGYGLVFLTQYGATLIAAVALLLVTSWKLALLTFVLLPPIPWLAVRYSRRSHPILRDIQQKIADVTTQAEENIVGVRVVKAFAQERREGERFDERAERVFERQIDSTRLQARYRPLLELMPQLALAVIILVGGIFVIDGELTIGEFFSFDLYLAMLIWPLRMIGMWIGQYQRAIASGERIFQLIDEQAEIASPSSPRSLPAGDGDVRFEGVRFGYDADRPVLDGLDLEIPAGRTVALIGRTGSGKTTLAQLIPRFYDPQAGRVLLDGVDVREFQIKSLRQQVGMVLQPALVFPTSVRDNIAYGRPEATLAEVEHAARMAQLDDFLSRLPQGLNTMVGEGGATLSAGEQLRITIARAILRNAPILILDEPTSALDTHTESRIMAGLEELMRGRTTFVIAHRLSTVRRADKIIVLDKGRVAEEGSFANLMTRGGQFAELYHTQFGEEAPHAGTQA